jgi:hypothetical protein
VLEARSRAGTRKLVEPEDSFSLNTVRSRVELSSVGLTKFAKK